jgi:hypothetical protein
VQVPRLDPAEGPQLSMKRATGAFTGVAVHLASAISIIIPRPLAHAVAEETSGSTI